MIFNKFFFNQPTVLQKKQECEMKYFQFLHNTFSVGQITHERDVRRHSLRGVVQKGMLVNWL